LKSWKEEIVSVKSRVARLERRFSDEPRAAAPVAWCPITPTPRQATFLDLACEEALMGGAAGGGKTAVLLAWALEGADTPGYSAIIFRRTLPEHKQSGGFIPLSHEWLAGKPAQWNGSESKWTFPSGATLRFASMQHEMDMYRFQGGQYIRAVFDELTHFSEASYLWIMSRLRRRADFPFQPAIRSGSNPGGAGMRWVRDRFLTDEAMRALRAGESGTFWKDGRAFVPSRLDDNPFLDRDDYRRKLQHLPPVLRERLLNGDWTVSEDGVIDPGWFRYFEADGSILRAMRPDGTTLDGGVVDCRECCRFASIDTAGTDEDAVRKSRGKDPSWTVASVWDYWPARRFLFLRHVMRRRVGWTDLKESVSQTLVDWGVQEVLTEDAHFGRALAAELRSRGFNVRLVSPAGKSKLERSVPLQNKLEAGEVYFPRSNSSWLNEWEAEFISWRGHPDDAADQIDTASYAATYSSDRARSWGGVIRSNQQAETPRDYRPSRRVASEIGRQRVATSLGRSNVARTL
jgi:predicted phage terminase large subunit-like protein